MHNCNDVEVYNSLVKKINEIINELNNLNLHKLESQRILNKCNELKNEFERDSYLISQFVKKNVEIISQSTKLIDILNTELENSRITEEQEGIYFSLINALNGYLRVNKITGNTLWVDNVTNEIITKFNSERNLSLISSFENEENKVEYKVTGKNKFDGQLELGTITSSGLLITNNSHIRTTNFIKIDSSNIIVSRYDDKTGWYCAFYDEKFNFIIRNNTGVYSSWRLEIPNNAVYFKLVILNNSDINSLIQIEEGTVATEYEPYKGYTKTLQLNSPLLEGDTIEESNGNVYHVHRYNKVVLDGSDDEDWVLGENSTDNYLEIICSVSLQSRNPILCDKFINKHNYTICDCEYIRMTESGLVISILKSKLSSTDLQGFKQWLQYNPVSVIYKLASPTYEIIEGNLSEVNESYEKMSIEFNTDIPVTLDLTYTGTPSTSSVSLLESDYLGTDLNDTINIENEDPIIVENDSIEVNNNEEEL